MIHPAITVEPLLFKLTTRGPSTPELRTTPPGATVCDATSYVNVKVPLELPMPYIRVPSAEAATDAVVISAGNDAAGAGIALAVIAAMLPRTPTKPLSGSNR